VAIAVTYTSVVARRDLPADTPIEASTIIVETRTGPLKRDPSATRVDQVAGKVLHRPVKGGAEILLSALDSAPVVHRGDSVRIEVRSGLAVLHFDAVAESTVRAGEFAEFRNPITGKTFRARVETAARAVVVVAKEPS
jgi:flagella basal body P-ring formation protein FlgA